MQPETPLRKARNDKGLTMQQAADAIGISLAQMSRLERHGTNSLPTAMKLAEVLKVPVEMAAPTKPDAEAA